MIQSRLYSYLGILLEGREWFEEECLLEKSKGKGQLLDERGPSGTIKTDTLFYSLHYVYIIWSFFTSICNNCVWIAIHSLKSVVLFISNFR